MTRTQLSFQAAAAVACLVLATSAPALAQTTVPLAADSGVATYEMESFSGSASLNGTYFDIRHQANSGVGYRNGFTQFGAFAPIWGSPDWFIAPNARVNLTNDSAVGFNGGFVARMYHDDLDRIFGANIYYDYDESDNNNSFDQVGFGIETLGEVIDARANGYVPSNEDGNFIRVTGLTDQLVFFGNRLGFLGTQLSEQAMPGGDGEVGIPLAPNAPWLRGYVGGYGYRRNNGDMIGGFRARVEGWVNSNLSLGTMVTTDNFFGTNVNFIADWRFPGFQPKSKFPQFSTRDRMLMPVVRHWRITVGEYEEIGRFAANNPRDGQPYFVVWVDPNGPLAGHGSGTYEDPFRRLPLNVPNETDLVMVTRGDSTAASPSIGKINLPDWARMLGQGRDHLVDAELTIGAFHASVDDASMPDLRFRNTGLYPFLTNPAGNIVNVANHNEVAAFVMTDAGGAAISGAHPDGFNFHHLEIRNNVGGIILTDAQGSGPVTPDGQQIFGGRIADINRDNNVVGWNNPLGLGNNGLPGGIHIVTSSSSSNLLDLTLERISMNATPNDQSFGIRLQADLGDLNVSMRNISTSGGNAVAGTSIEQFAGAVNATIGGLVQFAPGLESNNNEGVGLRLISGSDTEFNLLANNVNAAFNEGDNLAIRGNGNATVYIDIHNSVFSDSVTGTGVSLRMADGVKTLQLTNVEASRNADFGLDLRGIGGTLNFDGQNLDANDNNNTNLNIEMANGRFNGLLRDSLLGGSSTFDNSATGSGIILTANNSGALLFMNNISASGNFSDGLQINALNGSQIGNPGTAILDGVRVVDSTLINNGGIGINQTVLGGSHLDLFVDPTNLSSNGIHASRFEVLGGSTLSAFYDQTNFSNSITGSGLFGIVSGPGSVANVLVQNSLIRNSAADGVFLSTANGALANMQLTDVIVQNNGQLVPLSSGIQLLSTGILNPSTINLILDGNTVSNNLTPLGPQDYGLTVNASGPGTTVNVTATGTNFDNNNVHGVRGDFSLGSNGTFLFSNVSASNSGADGLNLMVDTGSIFNACFEDSFFDDNNLAGMRIRTQGTGSIASIGIENTSASNNLIGGGLVANVFNGAEMNLRTIGASFDGNGGDGVFVHAEGDDTFARLLFNTTSADDNGGNGFSFESYNGAYMTARIDSISAQNNALFGVRLDVQGVLGDGTFGILLPEGSNTIAGNGSGSFDFNFSGVSFAAVNLTGSFNNEPADGVNVSISNVDTALVSVRGDGTDTIDNNTFDGIDINISDALSAGVRIGGYASISGNGDNGIEIDLTNIADAAAVQINGPTDMIDNANSGIALTMTNVQLGNFIIPPGFETLSVVTLTDSSPLNDCFPIPVDIDFNTVAFAPTVNGILIEDMNIDRNPQGVAGQDGIRITGDQVTGAGQITLASNTTTDFYNGVNANFVNGSTFGGINVNSSVANNSAQFGFSITQDASGTPIAMTGSAANNSGNNGVNLALTNSVGSPDVTLTNVSAFTSGANGVALLGSGDIGNVTYTGVNASNSAAGDGIRVDLTGSNITGDILLTGSTVDQSSGNGINLLLDGVTGGPDVFTQNSTVTNSGGLGISLSAVGATLGAVVLDPLVITDSVGDGVRVDLTNASLASLLIDALTITNSGANGLNVILDGATGDFDTTISNIITSNSAGRGVQVVGQGTAANPLDLGDVTMTNISATDSTAGEGVRVVFSGDAVANADVGAIQLTNVSAFNSQNDGINLTLNTLTIGPIVSLQGGTSNNSATGDGIEVNFNNVIGTPDLNVSGYSVDNNANRGIAVLTGGSQIGDATINDNTVDDSLGGQGILANFSNGIDGSLLIDNNQISDSDGNGLDVSLSGVTGNPNILISDTNVSNSNGRGVQLIGVGAAGTPMDLNNVALTNIATTNSFAGEGVRVVFSGDAVANADIGALQLTNVSSFGSQNDGINVTLNTMTVGSPVSVQDGTSRDSATGDGIEVNFNNVIGTPDVNVSGYTVDNNAFRGIALITGGAQVGDVTVNENNVDDSLGGQGILIDISNGIDGSLLARDNTIADSNGNGLDIILNGVTGNPNILVSDTTVTNSNGRGVQVVGIGAAGTPLDLNNIALTNVTTTNSFAGEGVRVVFSGDAVANADIGALQLTNVSSNGSQNDGINVTLNTMTVGSPVSIQDGTSQDSATGDGIEVNFNNVIGAPDVNISGYTVDDNANRGIALLPGGSQVGDVTINDNTVSDSAGGQGIVADFTNGLLGSFLADNNTVSNSAGIGVEVVLFGTTGSPDITISDTSVSNSGGNGVRVDSFLATLGDITLTNVTSDGTGVGTSGIFVNSLGDTLGSIALNNVSANDSGNNGIFVQVTGSAMTGVNPAITLDGQGTAFSTNNVDDGIQVDILGVTGTPDITIANYSNVDNNGNRGIFLITNGDSVDDVTISGNTVSNSLGGQGILADLTNSTVGSVTMDTNTISNSDDNGLQLDLDGVDGTPDITISNTGVSNSNGRGVQVVGLGTAANPLDLGDIALTNVTVTDSTAGEGIRVVFSGDAVANANVGAIELTNVNATDSAFDGINVTLDTLTIGSPVSLQTGAVANSGGDGIEVNFNNVIGSPDVNISGFTVSNSAGRGIALLPGGSQVDDVTIDDNTVVSSLGGQGILADFTNGILGSLSMDDNTVGDSFGRGIDVILTGTTGLPNIVISDATVTNSGGSGISVTGTGSAAFQMLLGTIDLINPSSDTTLSEDGIAVILSADAVANGKVGDITVTNPNSVNSFGMGVNVSTTTMTLDPSITIDGQGTGNVSNNGAGGIAITLNNTIGVPTNADINVIDMPLIDENDGNGVTITAINTDIRNLTISGNGVHVNEGHGVVFDLTDSDVSSLLITGNRAGISSAVGLGFQIVGDTFGADYNITNTATGIDIVGVQIDITPTGVVWDTEEPGASIPFTPQNGTDVTTGLTGVNGNPWPNALPSGGLPDDQGLLDLDFNDFNSGETFTWQADVDFAGQPGSSVDGSDLVGSLINVDFAGGLFLNGTLQPLGVDGSQFVATGGNVTGAGISGNHGDGIHFIQNNSNIGQIVISDNEIANNDGITGSGLPGHGINFAVVNSSNLGPVSVTGNDILNNTGDGVRMIDPDTDNLLLTTTFTGNTIDGNTGHGVNLQISQGEALFLIMTGNEIGSEGTGNEGMGVRVDLSNASSLNATIGDSAAAANNFVGNADAGVGITLSDTATAVVAVENSNFTDTIDGADTNFDGVGLGISLVDSASLTSLVVGDAALDNTSLSNNVSHGFLLSTNGSATALTSNVVQHVTATENGGAGLQFLRQGNSRMNNTSILATTANDNTGNGLNLTIGDQNATSAFIVDDSNFNSNDGSGVQIHTIGDADASLTMTDSSVNSNGVGGIRAFSTFGITDTPTVTVNLQRNTMNLNTGSGFNSSTTLFGSINDNDISQNTVDGIHTTVGGNYSVTNNTIEGNDDDGIDITVGSVLQFLTVNISTNDILSNGDDGVAMRVLSSGNLTATVDDNLIQFNTGDGVQLASVSDANVTISANDIVDNGRRGINVVNGGGSAGNPSTMNLTINDSNEIARNGLEGVYLVNTASTTQGNADNIDNLASDAMLTDGSVFARPIMNLTMDANDVNSNGQSHVPGDFIGSTGIVLRVGTSDGSTSFTDNGGFASGGRGGVVASITNNTAFGNFASDVTFQPFISTADPDTTTGEWTDQGEAPPVPANDEFRVDSYVSDPLARLDLIFTGNTGNAALATRTDNANVFYANDEPEFKSRTTAQSPAGPFDSGTRRRNATRQASRGAPFNAPALVIVGTTGQNSSTYLYPGVGASTFRRSAASSTGGFPSGFTTPFTDTVPIGVATGELDFVWGTF